MAHVEADDVTETTDVATKDAVNKNWANPPNLGDLQNDYTDAETSHDEHVSNVLRWLHNLNIKSFGKSIS